jgi:hypothetical protein
MTSAATTSRRARKLRFEHDGEWVTVKGTKEALLESGFVRAGEFPGDPGRRLTIVRLETDFGHAATTLESKRAGTYSISMFAGEAIQRDIRYHAWRKELMRAIHEDLGRQIGMLPRKK